MARILALLAILTTPLSAQVFDLNLSSANDLVLDSTVITDVTVSAVQVDTPLVDTMGYQIFAQWDPASVGYLGADNLLPFTPSFFTTAQDGTVGVALVACLYDFQLVTTLQLDQETSLCSLHFFAAQGALPGSTSITLDNGTPVGGAAADPVQEITYIDATGNAQPSQPAVPVGLVLDLVSWPTFIRGDANQDQALALTDAIRILEVGFLGQAADCAAALDSDGDGSVSYLIDTLYLLRYLFQAGPEPAGGTACVTQDDQGLGCASPICP